MEKIWLKSYPSGVPAEVDLSAYASLVELFEESLSQYAQREAFVCMGKSMTYGQLDRLSRQMAAWLQARNLQPGARVALMMPNILQYPVAMMAVLRAGYVVVNVNPLYTDHELEHQLSDSGAEVIVVLENFAATLARIIGRTAVKQVIVASMGDLMGVKGPFINAAVRYLKKMVPAWQLKKYIRFNQMLASGARLPFKFTQPSADQIAFLQYTGGTTGLAKGAVLLHRNILANVLQSEAWLAPAHRNRPEIKQLITVVALPLYHVYALTVCALLSIRTGGLGILIPNPRDIAGLIKTLKPYPFNTFPAVNTLYKALLNHPSFGQLNFSKLLVAHGGGMAVQEAVARHWFDLTRAPIVEGYGLSETSPCVTCNSVVAATYSGTIGVPIPSTEVSIRDEDGVEVALGQEGEICIRGPQLMAGYWNRPEETAKAMTEDGFFKSGDIGVMDEDGFLKIVDRKKDMMIVSGFNVYPTEVEEVLAQHPGIFEAAAIGVPNEHSGEVVKIFVVKKDPALIEADVIAFCKERLTGYKRPKFIEFRAELPKTNVGKVLRRALREQI